MSVRMFIRVDMSTMKTSEHEHQRTVIEWAGWMEKSYPELELLHSVPNGGYRAKFTAARLKAEGTKSGVPDLHLPVARHGYHGLWIEMKRPGGKLSETQKWWYYRLTAESNLVRVCFCADEAINALKYYLGIVE